MKTLLTIALVVGMFSYAGAQTFRGNLHMAETATGGSVTGQGTTGTAFQSNSAATGQVAATSNAFAGTTADIHDFDINGVVKACNPDSGRFGTTFLTRPGKVGERRRGHLRGASPPVC